MKKKIVYILITLGLVLVAWFLYSWLPVRNIEEPKYKVARVADGYEIRDYNSYIIAETSVSGAKDRNEAANKGFPIVAGYIFGDNTTKTKIAMTVPVNAEQSNSEKIAMTAPVNTEQDDIEGTFRISFVLPSQFTVDTLPTPNDSRVVIKEVPSRKIAVRRFTWLANEPRIKENERALLSALSRDGIKTIGTVNVARYNPPWTIPFMLRNEVQVEISN